MDNLDLESIELETQDSIQRDIVALIMGDSDDEEQRAAEDRFLIDLMQWSFSRVNSYDSGCKLEWFLNYLAHKNGADGFFSAFGSFCHSILESYLKGEITAKEMPEIFEADYDKWITMPIPPNQYVDFRTSYFDQGLAFFRNFKLATTFEVVGVEKEVRFEIGGYSFVGYIDLLVRDIRDGKYVLIDHKTSTIKVKRDGGVYKESEEKYEEYKKQQYLYSKGVIEEFGEGSVKYLYWNLIKYQSWIGCRWNPEEYQKSIDWAVNTIHKIEKATEIRPYVKAWPAKEKVDFFCNYLCGSRNYCPVYLDDKLHWKERKEQRLNG